MTKRIQKRGVQDKFYTYSPYVNICQPIKNKPSTTKKTFGIVCLVIAVFPNGLGFIFYPLGFKILGITFKAIKNMFKSNYLYYKRRFLLYCHYKRRFQNGI